MRIMAVDYGDSRTGLAVCDPSEILASPLATVFEKDFEKCISSVAEKAKECKAGMIIVGDPINMNGTRGPRSEKCNLFAEKLREIKLSGKSNACFLIGSSFGISPRIKALADFKLSMGPMTFPHHLARIMVLEQIYRAEAIQAGSKYHK